MRRKRKHVCQCFQPNFRKFVPVRKYKASGRIQTQILYRSALEALKLHNVDEMSHIEAAAHMGISQPTYSRLLAQSYKIISHALVYGETITIVDEEAV